MLTTPVGLALVVWGIIVLLLTLGVLHMHQRQSLRALSTTAVAVGVALLVLKLLVIATHSVDVLHGLAESRFVLLGLPLASFLGALGVLALRSGLSPLQVAACAIVALPGLWWLGGIVLIQTACGFGTGGC